MSRKDPSIKSVMQPFPHSIGDHESLEAAQEMMARLGIRHLPVQRGGELLGILSDRDINFILAQRREAPENIAVKDSYTEDPYVVEPNVGLSHVVRRMADEKIGCAMVVEQDKLVGIFTTVDACRTLAELLAEKPKVK